MSFLGNLKKEWNYETDALRCGNCQHFQKPYIKLVDSLPRHNSAKCKLGGFSINEKAACDQWMDKEKNETAKPTKCA
jgi:hypothetical protein